MNFRKGDYVTRMSHGNDIIFQIVDISNNTALLKGIEVRLIADSVVSDLVKVIDNVDLYFGLIFISFNLILSLFIAKKYCLSFNIN